jgi:uncharacterized Zn finger protein
MNIETIRQLAGDTIFEKGLKIMRADQFVRFDSRSDSPGIRVSATVQGTQRYQVVLIFKDHTLQHHQCDCPAADFQTICKHAVATWLEYLDRENSDKTEDSDPDNLERSPAASRSNSTKKPTTKAQELANIHQWLQQQPKEQLIERLFKLVQGSPEIRTELAVNAKLAAESPTLSNLGKYITQALPKRSHLWEYRQVRQYFDKAVTRLAPVINHLDRLSPKLALDWCLKAFERLDKVLENIDDSGGFRFELETSLRHTTLKHYLRLEWPAPQRFEWLLQQLSSIDALAAEPRLFVADETERRAFADWLLAEFHAIEVPADFRQRSHNPRLNNLLRLLTEIEGYETLNHQRLILQEKNASTARDCLSLASHWITLKDELKAEDLLLRARQLPHERYEQERIDQLQESIDLMSGQSNRVWQSRWQAFLAQPQFGDWQTLWQLAHQYQDTLQLPDNWLDRSEKALLDKMANKQKDRRSFMSNHDAENIGRFYLETQQYPKLLIWCQQQDLSASLVMDVCATPGMLALSADQTLQLTHNCFDHILRFANNQAYKDALSCLTFLHTRWLPNGENEFRQLVSTLASTNKRRPNFYGPLSSQFAQWIE